MTRPATNGAHVSNGDLAHEERPERPAPQTATDGAVSATTTSGAAATAAAVQSGGRALTPRGLGDLQRLAGNRAAGAVVQAKLRVGRVDDPHEREADRVAEQVMRSLDGPTTDHQHGPGCGHDHGEGAAAHVQRKVAASGPDGGEVDGELDRAITQARGGGRPLEPGLQRSMEQGFGADFSNVRVHDDAEAHRTSSALGARAFTTGSDIFFDQGSYDPGSSAGQQLIAHELTHVVQQGGSQAAPVQRKAYDIGSTGEKLEIGFFTSAKKRTKLLAEAAQILTRLETTYGVVVSSATTVQGIKDEYVDVKDKVKNKLRTRSWRILELRSLERALKHYARILGAERATSTRAGADQEVTSVGKVKNAINEDTPAGKLDTTTLGEYFKTKKNMGLFASSEGYKSDFSDLGDQLTGTFVHEIAHGLLEYALPDYIKKTGYWKDRYNELPEAKRVENPITDYGETNAAEDLCESAMMFFVQPSRLKKACPKRYAFMKKLGKSWVPAPVAAPQLQPAKTPTPPSTPKPPPPGGEAEDKKAPPVGELSAAKDEILKIINAPESDEGAEGGGAEESSATPATQDGAEQGGSQAPETVGAAT